MALLLLTSDVQSQNRRQPELFQTPTIRSSWDDLTDGIKTLDEWRARHAVSRQRYLDLLRDQHKPQKPALDLRVEEETVVGKFTYEHSIAKEKPE